MTMTQIQVCVTCKYPSDRAWKSVKHEKYGEVWAETGVCRQCWSSFINAEEAKAKKEAAEIMDWRTNDYYAN